MNNETTYRKTRQRELILEVLRSTTAHPTADWVYAQVKEKIPSLSLGTVYRNLKILKDQGEIIELPFGATFDRFDGNALPHHHFICRVCGKVYDLDVAGSEDIAEKIRGNTEHKVNDISITLTGSCENCLKK